ncbi:MAG TPA: MHYT domain-containing protein, partial [Caulobacteraceae bacterium]
VLGGGIWSMHFIAMLAMNAGIPIGYDFDLTAISLLTAIAIVAVGFHLVTRPNPSIVRQLAAGCVVGIGVAAMHYTGMAAMVLDGTVHYDPVLVAASVVVAVVAATAALWLTLNLTRSWQRIGAAVVMAVAVCGMHYTGMAATSILCSSHAALAVDPLSRVILAGAVSVGMFLILCLAMVCVFADRRFEFLAEREAEGLRAANQALTESQGAISNLLDNADQGFLTVGPDLLVGVRSSAACAAILGVAPAGMSIIDLLCGASAEAASTMRATLASVFADPSEFSRELKLELLPSEFALDGRFVTASYKFLADSGRLMLILTDVTQTRLLAQEVERERKRLEMIVLSVTEGEAFAALVGDYRRFLAEELPQLAERFDDPAMPGLLYRHLHTFKGLLAQFSFPFSPTVLHETETRLASQSAWTAPEAKAAFAPERLLAALASDLDAVGEVLGPDFATTGRRILLTQAQHQAMEKVARAVLAGEEGRALSPPLRLLLQTLADLGMLDVKAALSLHSRGAPALAARLGKQLGSIAVQGDDVALPPERYLDFLRSLVHVFRNAVDHGLEGPEERELAGKPADGTITCDVRDRGEAVEIVITDDGAGIDRGELERRLTAAGEDADTVAALSLAQIVVREGLSSRDCASEVSGRGVGLAAVKAELDRLGGELSVATAPGAGTRFCFRLPINAASPARGAALAQRTA